MDGTDVIVRWAAFVILKLYVSLALRRRTGCCRSVEHESCRCGRRARSRVGVVLRLPPKKQVHPYLPCTDSAGAPRFFVRVPFHDPDVMRDAPKPDPPYYVTLPAAGF